MTLPALLSRPAPKPGISDIAPYVPGKSGAKGQRVFKLSSNESPLGPSPKAIEAYRACGLVIGALSRWGGERLARGDRGALRAQCAAHRVRRGIGRVAAASRTCISEARR